jgi:hypothetical protein
MRIQVIINYITLMRKFLIICFFGLVSSLGLFFCGLHDFYQGVSEDKMVEALQEALFLGSKTAANNLGNSSCAESTAQARECATGYLGNKLVEIAVPDTVIKVLNTINSFTNTLNSFANSLPLGLDLIAKNRLDSLYNSYSLLNLGKYGDSIKVALNRGAEMAAPQSVDVFEKAIRGMSITNAKGILTGTNNTAATSYLHSSTYSGLQTSFKPIIREPLKLLDINKHWKPIASSYKSFVKEGYLEFTDNLPAGFAYSGITAKSFPLPPAFDETNLPDDLEIYLSEYATGKALDGLFLMVGQQESKLRADPLGAVKAAGGFISDAVGNLLVDVFGKAKNNML